MDRPRVLLVAPQPFYAVRGTPMNVLQMCRVLTGAGYEVDLATYPLGEEVSLPRLTLHRGPSFGLRRVAIGFSWRKVLLDLGLGTVLLRLLLRRRYRVVHAIEEAIFLVLPLSWIGVPVVYDLDSLISEQLAYSGSIRSPVLLRIVRGLESLALRRSRAVVTVCQALTDAARARVPGARIFQVEDAPLREALRAPDPERVRALRAEHRLEGRKAVVYSGNLEPYQGVDLLVDGFARLRTRVPEAVLVIVGGESEHLKALRGRAAALGVEKAVRIVGPRPPAEMPEWMGLADVLVSPRRQGENTPLKIYGYMQSGRPLVATAMRTHTQVLDDSTAILCPPTAEGLADAIAHALQAPEDAAERVRRARTLAENEYSPAAFERKLLSAYAEITGEEMPRLPGTAAQGEASGGR